jgi:hypothetical protein
VFNLRSFKIMVMRSVALTVDPYACALAIAASALHCPAGDVHTPSDDAYAARLNELLTWRPLASHDTAVVLNDPLHGLPMAIFDLTASVTDDGTLVMSYEDGGPDEGGAQRPPERRKVHAPRPEPEQEAPELVEDDGDEPEAEQEAEGERQRAEAATQAAGSRLKGEEAARAALDEAKAAAASYRAEGEAMRERAAAAEARVRGAEEAAKAAQEEARRAGTLRRWLHLRQGTTTK